MGPIFYHVLNPASYNLVKYPPPLQAAPQLTTFQGQLAGHKHFTNWSNNTYRWRITLKRGPGGIPLLHVLFEQSVKCL